MPKVKINIMKTLFPKQIEAKEFFLNVQRSGGNTLDTSDVGTGKTVVAAHLAAELDGPIAIISPKSVLPSWRRELDEVGVDPVFVLNYEKIRTGNTEWMSKVGKKIMRWNLPENTTVFIDEIHRAKGPYTQNAQIVISLVNAGFHIHGMSATAAEDPSEMRGLGYMLGLHNLNKSVRKDGKIANPSWVTWMTRNGCDKDFWGAWGLRDKSKLPEVRDSMYEVNTKRLTVDDMPDAFRANRVFVENIEFKSLKEIQRVYEDLGITPEIVEQYIVDGKIKQEEHTLTNILRARQLAEGLKAPDISDMAQELVMEGMSVVIFVNFSETVEALCDRLGCDSIDGKQKKNRQDVIDDFVADRTNCVVVNTTAGGEGVSLHDKVGNRPRVSLISPAFSAKDYVQVLGRIHRNGMKSDAIQKILVADGSIEEHVMKSMQKRLSNLKTMQNQ